MYVTRHSEITDRSLIERLWQLYRRSYLPVAQEVPTHEMLDREEFDDQLRSASNRLWVIWDDDQPVGMTLVSTDIRSTRWLSTEYFAKHFPDHLREGRVHYVVWVTVDPAHQARGSMTLLARQALAAEARDGALLVFDTPEFNQPSENGGAAELLHRLARMVAEPTLLPLNTQRYFALDFAPQPLAPPETVGSLSKE